MSIHVCPNCNKEFQRKGHLSKHLNKKFKCKKLHTQINNVCYNPILNAPNPHTISYNNPIFPTQSHTQPTYSHTQNIHHLPTLHYPLIPPYIVEPEHNKNIINPNPNLNPNINISNPNIKKSFQCSHCLKTLSDSNSLRRHIKQYCKVKKSSEESLIEKNKQLEEQVKRLEEENKNMKHITINNTHINNINITLVDHGKEDLSKIANFLLLIASKRGLNAVPELVDHIHFNPNYPEFHNIYIPSIKDKHIMVYNKNWEIKNTADVVSDIYEERKNFIIDNKDVFYDLLDEGQKRSYNRWVKYDSDRTTDEAKQFILETFDKIKLLLFNKRNIPLNTKKQLDMIDKNNNILEN